VKLDVRKLLHPLMTADDVAYFLGLADREQVYKMVKRGELDVARLPDGTEFRPLKALLFRALDFADRLDDRQLELFLAWQRGELELPGYHKKDGRTDRLIEEKRRRGDDRERRGRPRSGR
jgi:hypothetical protein